jgi:hypothetical protein
MTRGTFDERESVFKNIISLQSADMGALWLMGSISAMAIVCLFPL